MHFKSHNGDTCGVSYTPQTTFPPIASFQDLPCTMEDGSLAHNCEQSPARSTVLSSASVQEQLATLINRLAATTVSHWWKLIGDDPNGLCKLLDASWKDMRSILRKCKVLFGPNDSFRVAEFENLMTRVECRWSLCRPAGKVEHFLCLGGQEDDTHAVFVPKDMCSIGGALEQWPISGTHLPGVRTKQTRRLASSSTLLCGENPSSVGVDPQKDTKNQSNKQSMTHHVNELIEVAKSEMLAASHQGSSYNFSARSRRMIQKATIKAVKGSVRTFLDAWVDHVGDVEEGKEGLGSPLGQKNITGRSTSARGNGNQPPAVAPAAVDLTENDEADEDLTIDMVLAGLKEEMLLQNPLHKHFFNNEQRVLTLEHKNGRKFRAMLPPDAQSCKAFVEEAKKTQWVNQMLHDQVHMEGILHCLAVTQPDQHVHVAEERNIRITGEVLNTPQTLALGRLTGINDTQMAKMRSCLKHMGNAELKMTKSEVLRLDNDVGLSPNSMRPATFSTCTLEWSSTKGKLNQKKAPEHCAFWNGDLLVEVAAEVDLLHHTVFLKKPNTRTPPLLDYCAAGFDSPGIVILFGGDHGAGACPCGVKLNLSSPQERKERGELKCRCPTMQIASIDCSKDTCELLSNTIMPQIQQLLISLRNSKAFVLCSTKFPKKCRKALLLPNTLNPTSFNMQQDSVACQVDGRDKTTMLADHFNVEEEDFNVDDLRVIAIISNFHDLCVGDLAFLAMAIGMNNSAGAHCVFCKKKAREFVCDQMHPDSVRTKASLTQCLNEHNRLRLRSRIPTITWVSTRSAYWTLTPRES